MTSDPRKSLIHFDIPAIASVSGLLFIATISDVGLVLWSIPAMTLFAVAGLTLLLHPAFRRRPAPLRGPRATDDVAAMYAPGWTPVTHPACYRSGERGTACDGATSSPRLAAWWLRHGHWRHARSSRARRRVLGTFGRESSVTIHSARNSYAGCATSAMSKGATSPTSFAIMATTSNR